MLTLEEIKKIYEKEFMEAEANPKPFKRMSRVDEVSPRVMEVFMHPDYLENNQSVIDLASKLCKEQHGNQ